MQRHVTYHLTLISPPLYMPLYFFLLRLEKIFSFSAVRNAKWLSFISTAVVLSLVLATNVKKEDVVRIFAVGVFKYAP